MKDIHDIRTAFLGVSHWHVPLYMRAVEQDGLQVVAVSDENQDMAAGYGKNQTLSLPLRNTAICRNWLER